jgi:hypothetical protein
MTTDATGRLTADDLHKLRHALGFRNGRPPNAPHRNHDHTAGDDPSFMRLVAHGFARLSRGPDYITGGDSVFAVTVDGMRAVGCTPKFIKQMQELR